VDADVDIVNNRIRIFTHSCECEAQPDQILLKLNFEYERFERPKVLFEKELENHGSVAKKPMIVVVRVGTEL
jgi:hypothetical protein